MNIEKGLVNVDNIFGIPVKVNIIEPYGKANVRTLKPMVPRGITVHNTANTNKSAGDEAHGKYLSNLEKSDSSYLSWHFTVDHDSITQHLPLNEMGWHAGDGSEGFGNKYTIAIEIAENYDYEKCEENGIILICWLMKEFGFSLDDVYPHRKFSSYGKLCPRRILKSQETWESDWADFLNNKVKPKYAEVNNSLDDDSISIGDIIKVYNKDFKVVDIKIEGGNLRLEGIDKEYENVKSFLVKVTASVLNIREKPSTNSKITGQIRDKGVYTIVDVDSTGKWGKLKSGVGWISLSYVNKLK